MPLVAWVTLILFAIAIAFVAIALLRVIFHLRSVSSTLGSLIGGLRVVAQQTRTVPEVVPSVNANLKPVRDWSESV